MNRIYQGKAAKVETRLYFPIRTAETTYLFLQHYIKILKAGGRAGIVIKNTFLSNTDNASVSLRRHRREAPPTIPVQARPRLDRATAAGRGCRQG